MLVLKNTSTKIKTYKGYNQPDKKLSQKP